MQDFIQEQKQQTNISLESLSLEERGRLVGAFVWLIQEDKKQNPAFYQLKKQTQND